LDIDVLIVDKGFGVEPVLAWLSEAHAAHLPWSSIVWGTPLTEAEALRFVRNGARGILRKTAAQETILECIRAVARGECWTADPADQVTAKAGASSHSGLTPREHQVLELVELGHRNREIAEALGIRPGTVKIHLKHIFEKTGIRGRYGLALNGFREKVAMAGYAAPVPEECLVAATGA
jgi:DNA-binding NarL/FixJ family response regulator